MCIRDRSKTPGSGSRRGRTPSPALNRRTITRYEDKRDMDVNNYTLEMRIKFCKDLRLLAEQIEETKQRILAKVEEDVQERTSVTQAENSNLQDQIDSVQADKDRILELVADLRAQLKALQSEAKDTAARRPKVEAQRVEVVEKRRRVKVEEEDLREALAAAEKAGNDIKREIAAADSGVVDFRRKAVLKAEECERMNAQLPGLQTEIDTQTAYFREDLAKYEAWMREHGLDPTANWNIAGADQIEALRQLLKKEFAEALAHREAQIDAENTEEWEAKNDRLGSLRQQWEDLRKEELVIREELAEVTTERDDIDAEIKALKMVIDQLVEAKLEDADHMARLQRVQELQARLKELEDQLIPLRARELDLIINAEKLKSEVANERPVLEGYLNDIDDVKAKRIKAEKEVAKALRGLEAAQNAFKSTEGGIFADIESRDNKINDLQKKVEELQREKLNADWISLQAEITEYKVILTGWRDELNLPFTPRPERMEEDCLLYTSDAADEEDSVDLGGRRIIKKKKKMRIQ
eukprot:TRINITY_DN29458_c0_g1_i2.p1 TRINITY_DN29458_c0_g1~~TRINITY_DN29458_c0_g1_i2.p1  ORF type:complete len:525 (+),score=231.30 TRINITY_DN29458_c0_g1_i2:178-1752(+)